MKKNEQNTEVHFNVLKWLVVIGLVITGIVANAHYASVAVSLRLIGWILLIGVTGFIALQTSQGRKGLNFARESRVEMRKVVWPTRQETVQTTFIVIGMTLLAGILLWMIDSVLLWAIGLITT